MIESGERSVIVTIYDGKRYEANPRDIPLHAHAQIQLDAGTPLVAPEHITFPNGLQRPAARASGVAVAGEPGDCAQLATTPALLRSIQIPV